MTTSEIAAHINNRFGDTIATVDEDGDIKLTYSKVINYATYEIDDWVVTDDTIYPFVIKYKRVDITARQSGKNIYRIYNSSSRTGCLNPDNTESYMEWNYDRLTFDLDVINNVIDAIMLFFDVKAIETPVVFEEELAI